MLTKEELQKIIDRFDQDELKRLGIFGISQYGGGPDESFIKANKEGLVLFALELLKAGINYEPKLFGQEKQVIVNFDYDDEWIDENSDTFIHYIELIEDREKPKSKSTFVEKAMAVGCFIGAIIALIPLVVGVITILNWLF